MYSRHARRLLRQFQVQPDAPGFGIAASPAGLHFLDAQLGDRHAHLGLPLGEQRRQLLPKLFPVPLAEARPPACPGRCRAARAVPSSCCSRRLTVGRSVVLDHIEPVAPAPEVVAFAGDHLALRLAVLLLECGLLAPDPAQARDDGQPHGLIIEAQRRGHAHPPVRRVDAHVEVLDVLAHDLDGDPADFDRGAAQ